MLAGLEMKIKQNFGLGVRPGVLSGVHERLCNPNYWEDRIFARSIETGGSFDQVPPGAGEIPIMLSSAPSVLTYSCYYGLRIELALGIWNFCISFSYTLALFLSRKRGFTNLNPWA